MRTISLLAAVLTLGLTVPSGQAQSIRERGQTLYELRCGDCHKSSLHKRSRPAARNYEEIRKWVIHWNREIGASWEKEDLDAVTQYLNERFYKYECPGETC